MTNHKTLKKWGWMLAVLMLLQSCKKETTPEDPPGRIFPLTLSETRMYQGTLSDLIPASDVFEFNISTRLFTDYAQKQRLIKLPAGTTLEYNGDGAPIYPNGTIITKTFYYWNDENNQSAGKQIIETRYLKLRGGAWVAANYRWNQAQTEASLTMEAEDIPITWLDGTGTPQSITYELPSHGQCIECHVDNGATIPLGVKLRNLNYTVAGHSSNQLEEMEAAGFISGLPSVGSITALPNWDNLGAYTTEELSRAYFDVNCAHCHSPGGDASNLILDLRYETEYDDTGIYVKRQNILSRLGSTIPNYKMPKLGRTIVDTEAYQVVENYINSL